jgi:hypothetical protein
MDINKTIERFIEAIPYIDSNTLEILIKRIKIRLLLRGEEDEYRSRTIGLSYRGEGGIGGRR